MCGAAFLVIGKYPRGEASQVYAWRLWRTRNAPEKEAAEEEDQEGGGKSAEDQGDRIIEGGRRSDMEGGQGG